MSKNIYLVYDANIETTESINKLLQVLDKAGYDVLDTVLPITSESFKELLDTETPNFAICLNKTFKDFSITYSDKLEVPIFEFFSKEYLNKDLKIYIAGLLLNIDDIFNVAYKRYAWDVLNKFLKHYNEIITLMDAPLVKEVVEEVAEASTISTEIVEEDEPEELICDYLDDPAYKPEPRVVKPVVTPTPVVESIVAEDATTESFAVVEAETVVDESLKDFYLNVKQLISQFNLVQDQLKQIENKFSAS